MTPVDRILAALKRAGREPKRSGKGWSARCPAHDDGNPSLTIAEGDDGRALLNCHAGCKFDAICAALEVRPADLFPAATPTASTSTESRPLGEKRENRRRNNGKPAGRSFATATEAIAFLDREHGPHSGRWPYHDVHGEIVGWIVRWDPDKGKKFYRPIGRDGDRWRTAGMPTPRPLYALHELAGAERTYVTEGEKAADALRALGLNATTSSHGSKSAGQTDWSPLAGKECVIWPDNDEPGRKYAETVAAILGKLTPPAVVKRLDMPGLRKVGDAADWTAGHPNAADPDALRAELGRLAAEAPEWTPAAEAPLGPILVPMADVERKEISWLWSGRVPLGRITLLVGKPGDGKSFLTTYMAARVSTGTPWPDGSECPKGSVILISAEDDPGDTIRPRLDAHGADVDKVCLLSEVEREGGGGRYHRLITLNDVDDIEEALRRTPDCKLIVIDPIGSFVGGRTDAHRDNEVRGVLAPVAKLAERHGAALLVVVHCRKGVGTIADENALGSVGITGIARAVWHVRRDENNKARRLFLSGKNNLAPEGTGLAFTITGEPPRVVWESDPVEMSADDALRAEHENGRAKPGPDPVALTKATEWLRDYLSSGPVESAAVKRDAEAAGFAWRTVQRAKDALGVEPRRQGFGGPSIWELPADSTRQAAPDADNLASWHECGKPEKNSDSKPGTNATCQDDASWQDGELPDDEWGEVA